MSSLANVMKVFARDPRKNWRTESWKKKKMTVCLVDQMYSRGKKIKR